MGIQQEFDQCCGAGCNPIQKHHFEAMGILGRYRNATGPGIDPGAHHRARIRRKIDEQCRLGLKAGLSASGDQALHHGAAVVSLLVAGIDDRVGRKLRAILLKYRADLDRDCGVAGQPGVQPPHTTLRRAV